jgi:Ni,Fe-hydrogenase III small subunit
VLLRHLDGRARAEYSTGPERAFVCFCGNCGWSGDIHLNTRVIGHEPEH